MYINPGQGETAPVGKTLIFNGNPLLLCPFESLQIWLCSFRCNIQAYFPHVHYENMPMLYTVICHGCKNDNFQFKKFAYFHIFAQNIDCRYTLEPPQWYTPVNPNFNI